MHHCTKLPRPHHLAGPSHRRTNGYLNIRAIALRTGFRQPRPQRLSICLLKDPSSSPPSSPPSVPKAQPSSLRHHNNPTSTTLSLPHPLQRRPITIILTRHQLSRRRQQQHQRRTARLHNRYHLRRQGQIQRPPTPAVSQYTPLAAPHITFPFPAQHPTADEAAIAAAKAFATSSVQISGTSEAGRPAAKRSSSSWESFVGSEAMMA